LTVNLTHQTLHGETINLIRDKNLHALGPGLKLEDCTIISSVGTGGAIFADVAVSSGTFNQTIPLKNFEFGRTHFDGVRFSGTYSGVTFGNYADSALGSIRACDFSAASLDGCRFAHCDADTMIFPSWPCFVIVKPQRSLERVRAGQWPGDLGLILDIACDQDDAFTVVTIDLSVVEGIRNDMLPTVRDLLKSINGVRISGES
jgi:hypothetical protein